MRHLLQTDAHIPRHPCTLDPSFKCKCVPLRNNAAVTSLRIIGQISRHPLIRGPAIFLVQCLYVKYRWGDLRNLTPATRHYHQSSAACLKTFVRRPRARVQNWTTGPPSAAGRAVLGENPIPTDYALTTVRSNNFM